MIYYSHINEDNRIERRWLEERPFNTVVAICGSGERVLSLMDNKNCSKFIIVDVNEEALNLLQLKLEALKQLSVEDYLKFIGHHYTTKTIRLELFNTIKQGLPIRVKQFWELKEKLINRGILYAGHFERFLNRIRPVTNLFLGKKFQKIFDDGYHKKAFPQRRWNVLKKLFSYKLAYQLAGNADVAFIGKKTKTHHIPESLNETITANKASSSFMAHLIFKGTLSGMLEVDLPPSLQKEVLSIIKERLVNQELNIQFYTSDLLEFVLENKGLTSEPLFYSLSDILSFTDFAYLQTLLSHISVSGNLIAIRSFLSNRLTEADLELLSSYGNIALHDKEDSTLMYQVFSVNNAVA